MALILFLVRRRTRRLNCFSKSIHFATVSFPCFIFFFFFFCCLFHFSPFEGSEVRDATEILINSHSPSPIYTIKNFNNSSCLEFFLGQWRFDGSLFSFLKFFLRYCWSLLKIHKAPLGEYWETIAHFGRIRVSERERGSRALFITQACRLELLWSKNLKFDFLLNCLQRWQQQTSSSFNERLGVWEIIESKRVNYQTSNNIQIRLIGQANSKAGNIKIYFSWKHFVDRWAHISLRCEWRN